MNPSVPTVDLIPQQGLRHDSAWIVALALLATCLGAAAQPLAQTSRATPLPGRVWHSYSDLSSPKGTFVLDPNSGASRTVDNEKWAVPWPDGNYFVRGDFTAGGSSGDQTRLIVRQADTDKVITDHEQGGDFGSITPAPDKPWLLTYWSEQLNEDRRAIVYNVANGNIMFSTKAAAQPDVFAWMPDRTLLRATPAGALSRVTIGGGEARLGAIAWPEGRVPQAIYASPDGTRMLAKLAALRDTGTVSDIDLWIMNIDGSGLRRFTKNGIVSNAFWSPDGRYIAFTKATGVVCTAATCNGSCTVWYAPATASNVVAVPASGDAARFRYRRPDGSTTTLGCPMTGWTR